MMTSSQRRGTPHPLRQRGFLLAWSAGLISVAGDWMLKVALPIGIFELTGSVAATGGVVIAGQLPTLLFGPVAGVFADRWDRRRIMVATCLLQALAVLPLAAMHSPDTVWIGYAVAFAVAGLARFAEPAEGALLPMLVGTDQLVAANALNAVNNNLARLAGPALGGVTAATGGLTGIALADAGTFLAAAALLTLIRGNYRASGTAAVPPRQSVGAFAREFAAGLRVIRRSPVLRILIGAFTATSIGEGVMATLFVVYVKEGLHGGVTEVGWLMSAQAIGGIAGGVAGGWVAARFRPVQLVSVGLVMFGVVDIALFAYPWLSPVLWPALLLLVAAGIPAVVASSAAMAEVQAAAGDGYRGRVLAVAGTAMGLAGMLGASLASMFGGRLDPMAMLVVAQGGGLLATGLVVGVLLRRRRTPESPPSGRSNAPVEDALVAHAPGT